MGMGQALSYHHIFSNVSFIAHICRIHLSSKGISPCIMCGGRLVCWMAICLWECQANGSILKEKKVLASIACISSLRLMTSDPEVSFTIKKRPGARREQWLHCPWPKKSCCLVRVAASLKAGEFRPRILKNKWRIFDIRKLQLVDKDQ